MMDLIKVRSYYIACGYTDLRLGIDGLAAVVTQQYGSQLNEESLFLFCGRRTDRIKALYWTGDGYIVPVQRQISVAQVGSGAEAAGSPELSLAHGRTPNRAENSHPQRKPQGFVLTKIF